MQLGIVIYSNEVETVFNAFRVASYTLDKGDQVQVFLLAKGVESEQLPTDEFDVLGMMQKFVDAGGEVLACGTCLKVRQTGASELCPMSTLEDLYQLMNKADKLLTF